MKNFIFFLLALVSQVAFANSYVTTHGAVDQVDYNQLLNGTTQLVATSNQVQVFATTDNGSFQILKMSDAQHLPNDWWLEVQNNSPGFVTVRDNGGNFIASVGSSRIGKFFLKSNATVNGQWVYNTPAAIADIITDHGQLSGLGDDDHPQYLNDTRGDAKYFKKTEFIDTSSGTATDAGKPVKTSATGLIDDTLLPAAAGNAWQRTGNPSTDPTTDYVGTADDIDMIIARNAQRRIQLGTGLGAGIAQIYGHAIATGDVYAQNFHASQSVGVVGSLTVGGGIFATGNVTAPNFLGNATTASAFDHTPSTCAAGTFAIGVAADGTPNCVAETAVTFNAFGSTPNANGASVSGHAITLQPADATNPGGVSTTTQTLAGAKTFSSLVTGQASFQANAGNGTTPGFYIPTGGGNTGFYFGANGASWGYNGTEVSSFISSAWKFNVPIQGAFVGSASSPTFFLDSSPNAGFYQIGTNNWGWSAASAKVLDMGTSGLGVTGGLNVSQGATADNVFLNNAVASVVPVRVKGAASQTADLLDIANSAGTNVFTVDRLGNATANAVAFAGNLKFGMRSESVATSNSMVATSSLVRLGVGVTTINGIAASRDGTFIALYNAADSSITIANESSSATSVIDRIHTSTGSDLTLTASQSVGFIYDGTISRWKTLFSPGSGSGSGGAISEYRLTDFSLASGWGSTDTSVFKFSGSAVTQANTGTGLTYANTSTNGMSITIANGHSGECSFSAWAGRNNTDNPGVILSINADSTARTTNVDSWGSTQGPYLLHKAQISGSLARGSYASPSWQGKCSAGDVFRMHGINGLTYDAGGFSFMLRE